MRYDILATGSKGNAVVLDGQILIDCGVPWKALKPHASALRLALLTHEHGDHLSPATVRRLALERPALRWGCGEWLAHRLVDLVEPRCIDVLDMARTYAYDAISVRAFPLVHDVRNCGYEISLPAGRAVYATDTNTLDGVEAKGADLYLIEANYGEAEIVERIRRKESEGAFAHEWDVLKNHLSREKALAWLAENMGPNSEYILMHGHNPDRKETM